MRFTTAEATLRSLTTFFRGFPARLEGISALRVAATLQIRAELARTDSRLIT